MVEPSQTFTNKLISFWDLRLGIDASLATARRAGWNQKTVKPIRAVGVVRSGVVRRGCRKHGEGEKGGHAT